MTTRTLLIASLVATVATLATAQTPPVIEELAGTYETTIVQVDIAPEGLYQPGDLVGDWKITFRPDGHIEWRYTSPVGVHGYEMTSVYVVHQGRLYIGAETGEHACQDLHGITAAVYEWSWAEDGALVMTAIEDECTERRIVLTAKPLSPAVGE